jgi:hypothetical protein
MRIQPTAFAWIDDEISTAPDWDAAQVRRLARHLGYELVWPAEDWLIPLVDQVRAADVDAVITPSVDHLGVMSLNALMHVANVETACPRMSFARWADLSPERVRS